MNTTEFLLRLKLQKGIGYVKLLTIAKQLDSQSQIEADDLAGMELTTELFEACSTAFNNERLAHYCRQIFQQCQVLSFFDEEYPEKLRQIYQPPLLLFVQGDVSLLKKEIVTIVGARYPTDYSRQVIQKLVPNLLKQNVVIASGLARGVDGLAHQAALKNEGRTLAVVGNGLNYAYPKENATLQKKIRRKGLLVSEYLPDTPPRPYRFPQRNRILAGLSQSVIVTEAKKKSGSLITASLALQENRDIYAVPGPITSQLSAGPNQLIEAGATPIIDFNWKTEKI